jgi:hypothetical protein
VSHQPERKAKDCLNCGTIVQGRFCHVCGQENIVTHQNFTALAKHFVYDIFHFDGKFFETLKHLFLKPGFVAKEYVKGRRASHLDPIRMYLFVSAVFFLFFFSFAKPDFQVTQTPEPFLTNAERIELANELKKELVEKPADSAIARQIEQLMDTAKALRRDELIKGPVKLTSGSYTYRSIQEYDSIQKVLPDKEKDGWVERQIMRKRISINEKYGENWEEGWRNLFESFLHRIPYLLFISLPFFALILKMLYRRRKNFFYSDHAIFTLYHYIFSFLILLLIFGLAGLIKWSGWDWLGWLIAVLSIYWFIYLYKSIRHFYGQKRGKTFLKFFLLNVVGFFVIILLFLVFIFFSIFQM